MTSQRLTPGKEKCRCRELGDSCGAAGQDRGGECPQEAAPDLDPCQGDSQFADLKCSQEGFAGTFRLVGLIPCRAIPSATSGLALPR